MISKFVDVNNLQNIDLGDEECICFIKADMEKYDVGYMQEWVMNLAVRMPNVQWCILPREIELDFCCKEDALKYLDSLKEKINEA